MHTHRHTHTDLCPSLHQSKNKSASAPSVYCFNHIHLDTATINKLPWGEIHCMYTSTNKPLVSVLLVRYIEAALLYVHIWMNFHPEEKVQTTLLNEQTFLAGFCFSYIWKDDRPNNGGGGGGERRRTPSKNKSVTIANVESLLNHKHDTDLHLNRFCGLRCKISDPTDYTSRKIKHLESRRPLSLCSHYVALAAAAKAATAMTTYSVGLHGKKNTHSQTYKHTCTYSFNV